MRLTARGYRVLGVLSTIAFIALMGLVGWVEGL